jgi:hypothetical protein
MWFSLFGMWFFGNLVDSIVSIIAPAMLGVFGKLRVLGCVIVRKMKSANVRAGTATAAAVAADGADGNNAKVSVQQAPSKRAQSGDVRWRNLVCCVSNATLRKAFTVGLFGVLVFSLTLLLFIIGARVFHGMALAEEKGPWVSLNEGVWFMFVTSTTIGFGDMTPNFMQVCKSC